MPSIGKDLQKIRVHLGYTIQDVQQSTKIPVSTLKNIENDYIFERSDEGTTYIRSFVRSYGRALRIDDNVMIKALDQQAVGNYSNLLLQDFPDLLPPSAASKQASSEETSPETPLPVETQTIAKEEVETKETESQSVHDEEKEEAVAPVNKKVEESEDESEDESDEVDSSEKVITAAPNTGKPDNEETLVITTETPADEPSPAKNSGEPSVSSVDWANLGNKAATEKKKSPAWIFGIILLVAVIGVAAYVLIDNGFFGSAEVTDSEQVVTGPPSAPGGVDLDLGNNGEATGDETAAEQTTSTPASLDDVLFITVFAAYDVLDPVRVWSDLKPRLDPYWLEQGTALNFEFQDTIRIRGPYANMLLFKNGHRISDFQEYFIEEENYVELTRDYFTSDAKWLNTIPFDMPAGVSPPQSVENRPTF